MHRTYLLLLALIAPLTSGLFADCCSAYELGGEILIMRASACQLMYVIQDPRSFNDIVDTNPGDPIEAVREALPQGTKRNVRSNYTIGFRAWAAYISKCNCTDFTLRYTRLETRDSRVTGPETQGLGGLWPTFAVPNLFSNILYNPIGTEADQLPALARARSRFNWDAVDAELAFRKAGCRYWGRAFLGIHFVNLIHHFDVHYSGTDFPGSSVPDAFDTEILSARSAKAWALGPQLGVEGQYGIGCNFSVTGRLSTGITAGGAEDNMTEHQIITGATNTTLDLNGRRGIHLIPFVGAQLGINYLRYCGCDVVWVGEFGYEFRTYIRALRDQVFTGNRASSRQLCESVNFDGFYVSLMTQF